MKVNWNFPFFVFAVLITLSTKSKAYVYLQALNTSDGYCETKGFGKIPVGEIGYDDLHCERGECSEGLLNGAGCGAISAPDGCTVVKGEGHYPDCCPIPECFITGTLPETIPKEPCKKSSKKSCEESDEQSSAEMFVEPNSVAHDVTI